MPRSCISTETLCLCGDKELLKLREWHYCGRGGCLPGALWFHPCLGGRAPPVETHGCRWGVEALTCPTSSPLSQGPTRWQPNDLCMGRTLQEMGQLSDPSLSLQCVDRDLSLGVARRVSPELDLTEALSLTQPPCHPPPGQPLSQRRPLAQAVLDSPLKSAN
jgi:hypothetical protein